jgi:hypothetical protein
MIIEASKNEVIFRFPGKMNVDELQDVADLLEFKEIARKSKATQAQVDKLVQSVKKGRWAKTKQKLGL